MKTDLKTLLSLCDDIENYNGPNLASNNGTHWISLEFCSWHEFSGNHTLGSVQWDNEYYPDDEIGKIRIIDFDMENLNPEAIDSLDIDVWSDTDVQGIDLTVTETGENTKIFEGTIFFSSNDESSGARLFVNDGDSVFALYNDTTTSDSDTYFEIIKETQIINMESNKRSSFSGIEIHKVNYPNPSKIQFFGTTNNLSNDIQIKVLNDDGNQIKPNVNLSRGLGGFEIIIDSNSSLEPLKDGTYFLVVIQDNPYYEFTTKFTVKGFIDTNVNHLE